MMSSEGRFSGSQSSAPPPGQAVTSLGLVAQESSWIGLLSRPAVSLLHRILPGRLHAAAPPDRGESWLSGSPEPGVLLGQLEELVPRGGGSGDDLSWLAVRPLPELGLPGGADGDLGLCRHGQRGHLSSAHLSSVRAALSQVLLGSQSVPSGGLKTWVSEAGAGSSPVRSGGGKGWWGSLRGSGWSSEGGLPPAGSCSGGAERLCPPPPAARTEAPGTRPSGSTESSGASGAGRPDGAPEGGAGGPRPRQEQVATSQWTVTPPTEEVAQQEARMSDSTETEEVTEEQETRRGAQAGEAEELEEAPPPQCQNKAIAFIMGCPCSDDSSQSELSSSDEDDEDDEDDGFDSEGSSELSDSASDGELDSEAERLWSAMSCSRDPYNPRNFSARLHTSPGSSSSSSSAPEPRDALAASPPSSAQSTPASSPPERASSCFPATCQDSWDESTSASEADEAESLLLWRSFSGSSDPYSPFNFQAPLRTRAPPAAPLRAGLEEAQKTSSPSSHLHMTAAPEYRKEEAEERLDSGFSEPCASSSTSASSSASSGKSRNIKKVRFSECVEEFFASCGDEEEEEEDRRGPWEQLARDRCRFLRRCLEVEQSIGFCLQPLHRQRVYQRLTTPRA